MILLGVAPCTVLIFVEVPLANRLKSTSVIGLLLTVVLLFGFLAEPIVDQPAWVIKLPFDVAAPAAMIGTSTFFELAVAVAISLFWLGSGAALATVVGVLIEVPVMLSLVSFANRTKGWFPDPGDTSELRLDEVEHSAPPSPRLRRPS